MNIIYINRRSYFRNRLLPRFCRSETGYWRADCHEICFPVEFWWKLSASVGVGQIPLVTSDARVMRFDQRLQRRWRRLTREQWLTLLAVRLVRCNLASNWRRAPWRRQTSPFKRLTRSPIINSQTSPLCGLIARSNTEV